MSLYAGSARERIIELDTALVAAAPTRDKAPHITLSPRTAQGLPTQGFAFTFVQAAVGAALGTGGSDGSGSGGGAGGNFNVTIYRCVPALGTWAELSPFTAAAHYGEQYVLGDISGSWGIYFQVRGVSRPGRLLLAIAEMD
jgi:hypothetical protein